MGAQSDILTLKVAARYKMAYFKPGDLILYGKWKNKKAKIVRLFIDSDRGIPMIEIEPIPKGRKQNKIMSLYTIRKAPVLE